MNRDIISYYSNRANEYEQIYSRPERRKDLIKIENILKNTFAEKNLLEIACGTGYWTERISETAQSVFATDINNSVLEIAKSKSYLNNNVTFENRDMFSLKPDKNYENLFGGFIWSHIRLQELDDFILKISSLVKERGTVVFIENNFVEGSSSPITKKDESGNTYQVRKLKDDSTYLVLKNFPSKEFIFKKLERIKIAEEIKFINLKYYWMLTYKNKG